MRRAQDEAHLSWMADNEPLDAAEIKVRAERRIGELLRGMPKAVNQHAGDGVSPASLADIGIEKKQSSRWQQEASIPSDQFENLIESIRDSGRPSQRLYRASHATFEDYCRERWNLSDRHANRIIDSARVLAV